MNLLMYVPANEHISGVEIHQKQLTVMANACRHASDVAGSLLKPKILAGLLDGCKEYSDYNGKFTIDVFLCLTHITRK